MQLKDQAPTVTLARRLGDTAHVSGLAIRLARLSGAGDRLPDWLLKIAVECGAKHYQRDSDPSLPPDNPAITNEEVGVALCLGQMPFEPWLIRAAAQLLSWPRVDPQRLTRGSGIGLCRQPTFWHSARRDLRAVARRVERVARPDPARALPAQRGTVRAIPGHGRQS